MPDCDALQMTSQLNLKTKLVKLFENVGDDKTWEMDLADSIETQLYPHEKLAVVQMVSQENSKTKQNKKTKTTILKTSK